MQVRDNPALHHKPEYFYQYRGQSDRCLSEVLPFRLLLCATFVSSVPGEPFYKSPAFRLFFKTPVSNPRPETSNTTVAGSGTSFCANEPVRSLAVIVFWTPAWTVIVPVFWIDPSKNVSRFGPCRGLNKSIWKEKTGEPFTNRSNPISDSALTPNWSVCTCRSSEARAEMFTLTLPSAPTIMSVPVKVVIAKEDAEQEQAPTLADVDPLKELVVAFAVPRALAKATVAVA